MDVINALVAAQEGGPLGINHPGNFCLGMRVANERGRGQRVNDVAEGAWLDDEDGTDGRFQNADFRLIER